MDEERVASELKGNALRVYWYLLQSSKSFVGPRQIQRKLGFSSPALAVYHLDKLVELGLVEKVSGEYHLTKIVDVGVLKQFMKLKGFNFLRTNTQSLSNVSMPNFHPIPLCFKFDFTQLGNEH